MPDVRIPLGGVDWSGQPLPAEATYYTPGDILAGVYGSDFPAQAESGGSPASLLSALSTIKNALGPSWLDRATAQTDKDIAAYQQGGPAAVLADTGETQDLAGGFAGTFTGKIGAGRLGKGDLLARVEALAAKGASPEEINAAVPLGSIGAEGMPRYEIADYGTNFTPAGRQAYERALEGQPVAPIPYTEAYAHPELYQAYPEFKDWKIGFEHPSFNDPGMTTQGVTDKANKVIYLNPEVLGTAEELRSTLLHEGSGHVVQGVEGHAMGGGFGTPEVIKAAATSINQLRQDIRNQYEALRLQPITPAVQQQRDALLRRLGDTGTKRFQLLELEKAYRSLAGEAEARNIQARADMPVEQLKTTLPQATEDVPRAQQLLRLGEPRQLDLPLSAESSFPERMDAARQAAFERTQKLGATGNYGLPPGGYKTPDAPKGSFERLAAEQRSGFQDDKRRILDQFRETTGAPSAARPEPILAPGEQDLQFSMGSDVEHQPTTAIGAPAIRNRNAPLFDYRGLEDVPNVPQFDLPRYNPPEGVPKETQALANPKNMQRVLRAVQAGEAMGGRAWYNNEPLRQAFVAELGEKEGETAFRQYLDLVAANSPKTRVPENIRNASYFYTQAQQGEDLPRRYLKDSYWRMVKSTQAPSPYGIMPIHVQNMENVLEHGRWPVLQNPKPASFVENLAGNQRPVTIDTHNMRALTGGKVNDVPGANEYGFLEKLQQEQAAKLGMTPAQYQASMWIGAGKETGLGSPTEPFLRVLEDRIGRTAEATGRSKAQILKEFIRGRTPLLSATPGLTLAGVLSGLLGQSAELRQ